MPKDRHEIYFSKALNEMNNKLDSFRHLFAGYFINILENIILADFLFLW